LRLLEHLHFLLLANILGVAQVLLGVHRGWCRLHLKNISFSIFLALEELLLADHILNDCLVSAITRSVLSSFLDSMQVTSGFLSVGTVKLLG
jgi:hypothetical protein